MAVSDKLACFLTYRSEMTNGGEARDRDVLLHDFSALLRALRKDVFSLTFSQ